MSGKIKKIKLKFNNINISYENPTINNEILKIKQVEFGNLNVFNTGDRRDKINVTIIESSYLYYKYNYDSDNGNGQTEYILDNIPSNTFADILLVAGGGGGGCREVFSSFGSGGGGAGGLVFELNRELTYSKYTIKVGKGGNGKIPLTSYDIENENNRKGKDTVILYSDDTILYGDDIFLLAKGGGQGGNRNWTRKISNVGKTGGSSGGSCLFNANITIESNSVEINNINISYGNIGGSSSTFNYSAGGGGGAGSEGNQGNRLSLPDGGSGINNVDLNDFKNFLNITDTNIGEHTDGKVYFAGGGGGCFAYDRGGGDGGIGGGGQGENGIRRATDGIDNTGGGGGGGRVYNSGKGGSGIVIIKLKTEITNDDLKKIIDNDITTDYELNNNSTLIFDMSLEIDRKDILHSLNQIIFKTEKISQIIELNYDVILENEEGEEILFKTINEESYNFFLIDNSYTKYTSSYFDLFTEERLYPLYIFRDLPILTNNTFTISNRLYGNGNYEINYSSFYDSYNNPLNIFKNDFTSFTWDNHNYTRDNTLPLRDIESFSTYNNDNNINYYNGEFISIKLPKKIILTKFVLVIKNYNNVTLDNLSKFPLYFKIFGKNNNIEWKEIVEVNINKYELNNIYNDQYFINSYYTRLHTYNYEGTNDYKEYILNLNKGIFCDLLIVAGGGAGGRSENANRGAGGGGGGELIYIEKILLSSGEYIINVGNGGQNSNQNGFNSSLENSDSSLSFIAYGGGGGGNTGTSGTNGKAGGSGGGGADYNGQGGISTSNNSNNFYGNNGGNAVQLKGAWSEGSGAGGGGASSPGDNSNSYSKGLGGSGKIINISGNDIEYAKGGDGGIYNDGNGINGLNNTGNGGNGAGRYINRVGGKGGSGVVIIKEYTNYYNSYKHVFDESNKRQTGLEIFDEYALVINKIGGGTYVDIGTWEIYGKEKFSVLNEIPSNIPLKRNIKFSHFYKVFQETTNMTSNISIDDFKNYTPQNNSNNLSFSTFRGLSIDSELPITDNILARYIPNNIYMIYSEDDNIVQWKDIYNKNNITNIIGSPSIQKITPNSNGLYTDNQRMTISTMKGTNDDIIQFPFTLPENYTFCYIARYTGNNNKRIFNSKNDKTYWCFNNNKTCVSMYNNIINSSQIKQISDNDYWIIGIETGDTMRYNGMDCTNNIYNNTYTINDTYIYNDVNETNSITINGGSDVNKGSWEIGELIFYDRKLTESEKINIEEYFAKKYYHISFSNVVSNITEYIDIISKKYSINSDDITDTNQNFYIWYNIYDGYKYAYSVINSSFYGPANYLFNIKRYQYNSNIYYYWILFVDNENTDNTNKFLEVTIPNSDNNLYLIALAGGGSAGSYNGYSGVFEVNIISGPGNAGELNIDKLEILESYTNITLRLQVGHGGKMIQKVGSDGGDSIITKKNSNELLNSVKGNKGLDYNGSYITNVNGGTISSILNTYKYDNLFSLDNILTDNYTYWGSDLIVDEQQENGIYYGYGAPGVIMNNEYSGSSGIVAIIQSYEIFRI